MTTKERLMEEWGKWYSTAEIDLFSEDTFLAGAKAALLIAQEACQSPTAKGRIMELIRELSHEA